MKANQAKFASRKGDALEFNFEGTAISLEGNWKKDAAKQNSISMVNCITPSTPIFLQQSEQTPINICHALNLTPGKHTLKIVVTGEKKPESLDSRIYGSDALVFKKNDVIIRGCADSRIKKTSIFTSTNQLIITSTNKQIN